MKFHHSFPMTSWIWRALAGRIARRIYLVLVLALLATSAAVRIHTFMLARRMEAVIAGLSRLQIDKSTEEDVKQTVPYLVRWQWEGPLKRSPETADIDVGIEQGYSVAISNESSWIPICLLRSLGGAAERKGLQHQLWSPGPSRIPTSGRNNSNR